MSIYKRKKEKKEADTTLAEGRRLQVIYRRVWRKPAVNTFCIWREAAHSTTMVSRADARPRCGFRPQRNSKLKAKRQKQVKWQSKPHILCDKWLELSDWSHVFIEIKMLFSLGQWHAHNLSAAERLRTEQNHSKTELPLQALSCLKPFFCEPKEGIKVAKTFQK